MHDDERLRNIAKEVILDHAFDIEFVSIQEMFEDLTDAEARKVHDLIFGEASVRVTWE